MLRSIRPVTRVILATTLLVACSPAPVGNDAQAMDGAGLDASADGDRSPITCASPTTPLEIGVRTQIETTPGYRQCLGDNEPPYEAKFSYSLPPGMYGVLSLEASRAPSPSPGDCETVLTHTECVMPACGPGRVFSLNCGISSLGPIGNDNETESPQTVYVYVGSSGTTPRPFWLTVQLFPRPSTLCQRAVPLVVGAPPALAEFANGAIGRDSCAGSPTLFYQVTAPPRSAARIAITDVVGEAKARLLESCAAMRCDRLYQPAPSELLAQNTTDSERTFIVEVSGGWSHSARVAHSENTPLAQRCSVPHAIAVGESLTDDTRRATNTASCASADSAALFYTVTVPARSRAHFSVRRSAADNVRVRVASGCASATCESTIETVDESETTFVIDNPLEQPAQRTLAVSAVSAPTEFSLAYFRTNELPSNTSCASVTPLFPGQSVVVDTSLGGGAPVGCHQGEGLSRYYSVVLTSGRRATVTVTQLTDTPMRVRTYDNCAMGVCANALVTTSEMPVSFAASFAGIAMGGPLLSIGAVSATSNTGIARITVSADTAL